MNRLLLQNLVFVKNNQKASLDSSEDIAQILETVSLDNIQGFENQILFLKYLVLLYKEEKRIKKKRIKENKLIVEVELLGKAIMNADLALEEKISLIKRMVTIVSISENAKNVAFRYRLWILGGLDK